MEIIGGGGEGRWGSERRDKYFQGQRTRKQARLKLVAYRNPNF